MPRLNIGAVRQGAEPGEPPQPRQGRSRRGAAACRPLAVNTLRFTPPDGGANEKDAVDRVGGNEWRARPEPEEEGVGDARAAPAPAAAAPGQPQPRQPREKVEYKVDGTVSRPQQNEGQAPEGGAPNDETELETQLSEALGAQQDLKARTDALEAQLQADQLRQTLSAAVVENQRLKERLEAMSSNRQQLLGGMPLTIGEDGDKRPSGAGAARRRSGRGSVADLSKPITVDPDTGGVHFESDMPRGAGMPLRQLPRPEEVDEDDGQRQPPSRMPSVSQAGSDLVWGGADGVARAQAQLDTAMVMTFGAVAASKLPPKRRPRLDPRVLDSLLNGTACEFCRCKQLCAANTLLAKCGLRCRPATAADHA